MKTKLLNDETSLAAGEAVTVLDGSYSARVLHGDYKKAEGIAWLQDSDVQKIRSFISIGAVTEAQQLLNKNPAMESEEVEFEKGRGLVFEAKFNEAKSIFGPLLKSGKLSPLSTMTAYQLKGLCEFELGNYTESINALDRVASFESVFPVAEAGLFAASLRIRALFEIKAIFKIEDELTNLWNRVIEGKYIISKRFQLIIYLLTLCHVQNDIHSCLGGMKLAQLMGSPIHEGIFLAYLSSLTIDDALENEVRAYGKRFPYVLHIKKKMMKATTERFIQLQKEVRDVIFLERNTRYDLKEDKLISMGLSPQNQSLLRLIKNGPISKEALFESHWKVSYNPLIHDTKIRTSLKRIREQTGIEVLSDNSLLSLPFTILV